MKAILALEDGTIFTGNSFGAIGTVTGEACFHTAMGGYQEILTDPASRGQIAAITYPQIGNYGIVEDDNESDRPQAAGLVIGELARLHSSYRANEALGDWMKRHGVPGIEGVDTRRLTRILSTRGSMRACLTTELSEEEAVACAAAATVAPCPAEVSCAAPCTWEEDPAYSWKLPAKMATDGSTHSTLPEVRYHIAALDLGIKRNTLRALRRAGFSVTVIPADTTAEAILAMGVDGLFISAGPGDPAGLGSISAEIAKLIGKLPLFGVALGLQLLGIAAGGKTTKLLYGHHGANVPVKDLAANQVSITAQNTGYALVADSLPANVTVTHVNLNDGAVEGISLTAAPAAGLQFAAGAAPGAAATPSYFDGFAAMINAAKA